MPQSNLVRKTEKRQLRNRAAKSRAKTFITRAEKLIFAGELASAQTAVAESISALDKAAEKGILHANNAARRKSRLMKKLNRAQVAAEAVVEEEVAEAEEKGEAEEKAPKKPKAEKKAKSK